MPEKRFSFTPLMQMHASDKDAVRRALKHHLSHYYRQLALLGEQNAFDVAHLRGKRDAMIELLADLNNLFNTGEGRFDLQKETIEL
jgi:hypothetical protein